MKKTKNIFGYIFIVTTGLFLLLLGVISLIKYPENCWWCGKVFDGKDCINRYCNIIRRFIVIPIAIAGSIGAYLCFGKRKEK